MSCSFQSLTSEDGVSVTDVLMLVLKLVYICKLSLVLSSQLEGKFAPSAGHNVEMCAVAVLPANSGTSSTTPHQSSFNVSFNNFPFRPVTSTWSWRSELWMENQLSKCIRTFRKPAETLQHADGCAGCVAAFSLSLPLVVTRQDAVGVL